MGLLFFEEMRNVTYELNLFSNNNVSMFLHFMVCINKKLFYLTFQNMFLFAYFTRCFAIIATE